MPEAVTYSWQLHKQKLVFACTVTGLAACPGSAYTVVSSIARRELEIAEAVALRDHHVEGGDMCRAHR